MTGPETTVTDVPGVPDYVVTTRAGRTGRYALVIPVINEGERILRQLRAIRDLEPDMDVYLADGGSTDGTVETALADGLVSAALVKRGPGKLSAQLRMAFHHVLGLGYDGIVTVDGNGKDGAEGIARIVAALDAGNDFVQGSRFITGGVAENTPLARLLGIRLVHAPLTSLAARHWYTDTTNGFRGHSRRLLTDARVAVYRDVFDTYELLAYLPIRAAQLGMRVAEVPVSRRYPSSGPVPTRITGVHGNTELLRIIGNAVAGRYDPPVG